MGAILSLLVSWLLAALVIFIVGKLNLGLSVDSFVSALIAAAVIAIVTWVVMWLLTSVLKISIGAAWFGALVSLVISALVLLFSERFVKGMKVAGFNGALIAAVAIAVVSWLGSWLLSLFGF